MPLIFFLYPLATLLSWSHTWTLPLSLFSGIQAYVHYTLSSNQFFYVNYLSEDTTCLLLTVCDAPCNPQLSQTTFSITLTYLFLCLLSLVVNPCHSSLSGYNYFTQWARFSFVWFLGQAFSLQSPGCSEPHSVDQAGCQLRDLLASVSPVLRLKGVCYHSSVYTFLSVLLHMPSQTSAVPSPSF